MEHNTSFASLEELFGKVIFAYTREMAINDGVLVDVTSVARTWGYNFHVAMTDTLFRTITGADSLQSTDDPAKDRHALKRLNQVLCMVAGRILAMKDRTQDRLDFTCATHDGGRTEAYALCHPGDHGEPCITFMLVGED